MKPLAPFRGHPRPAPRHHQGYSLVEVMVALAIGAIVVFGLAELLANTNVTYQREEAFGRLQENGRVAALIAAREMRQSRTTECKSIALHESSGTLTVKSCALLKNDTGCSGDHVLGTGRALGYDNSEGLDAPGAFDDLPTSIATDISERWVMGDVLVTWGVDADGVAVDGSLGNASGKGLADGTGRINVAALPDGLEVGDLAMISNCRSAHVFAVSGPKNIEKLAGLAGAYIEHGTNDSSGTVVNANDHLKGTDLYAGSSPYNRDANDPRSLLHPLHYRVFYICCAAQEQNGVVNIQDGDGVKACRPGDASYDPAGARPSLCVFDLNDDGGTSNVLVPDVADMRVTYTGDSTGDGQADFFADDQSPVRTAAWVSNNTAWDGVRSASVELLLTTDVDNTAMEPSTPADWVPDDWTDFGADALGAAYDEDDNRIYQRIRFDVALRPSTPWVVAD